MGRKRYFRARPQRGWIEISEPVQSGEIGNSNLGRASFNLVSPVADYFKVFFKHAHPILYCILCTVKWNDFVILAVPQFCYVIKSYLGPPTLFKCILNFFLDFRIANAPKISTTCTFKIVLWFIQLSSSPSLYLSCTRLRKIKTTS